MALSITTLSIMTFRIMAFGITTFGMMTFSIIDIMWINQLPVSATRWQLGSQIYFATFM
jgi:hypothetical protein